MAAGGDQAGTGGGAGAVLVSGSGTRSSEQPGVGIDPVRRRVVPDTLPASPGGALACDELYILTDLPPGRVVPLPAQELVSTALDGRVTASFPQQLRELLGRHFVQAEPFVVVAIEREVGAVVGPPARGAGRKIREPEELAGDFAAGVRTVGAFTCFVEDHERPFVEQILSAGQVRYRRRQPYRREDHAHRGSSTFWRREL